MRAEGLTYLIIAVVMIFMFIYTANNLGASGVILEVAFFGVFVFAMIEFIQQAIPKRKTSGEQQEEYKKVLQDLKPKRRKSYFDF